VDGLDGGAKDQHDPEEPGPIEEALDWAADDSADAGADG